MLSINVTFAHRLSLCSSMVREHLSGDQKIKGSIPVRDSESFSERVT